MLACIVAPIAPFIVMELITAIRKGFVYDYNPILDVAVYFGYFTMLFLGLPILYVCVVNHISQWWHLTIAGALSGALMPIGFILIATTIGSVADPINYALEWLPLSALAAMLGAGSGFAFWVIGLYRPMKSRPANKS